jgi:hypothetical protein
MTNDYIEKKAKFLVKCLRMCIFCCTFAHVYILPYILHHRANALPYSGMADLLDHSTPMPS